MRWEVKVLLAGILCLAMLVIAGCGGNNNQTVFQNVFDRPSYSPTGSRVAFESVGGNGLFYIYSVDQNGGNLVLLTPSLNDPNDLNHEGGKMPAWSPNEANNEMVMVARRGDGGQALYLINPTNPSINAVAITDPAVPGSDSQPNWSADGNTVLYVSNKGTDHYTIWTVNRDGTNAHQIYDPGTDAQWPDFSPDGTKIIFQLGIASQNTDTAIVIIDANGTNPVTFYAGDGLREEAPWFSPDGTRFVYHSNRYGDFDILNASAVDGGDIVRLTSDSRSDGYPNWNGVVNRIAFTRDRELWTMAADGTDQQELTRRF